MQDIRYRHEWKHEINYEDLLAWDVPNSFTSAVVSCPELKQGENYRITAGSASEDFTLSEISAEIGEGSGGFGGFGNFGGMPQMGSDAQSGERPSMPDGESFSPPSGEGFTPPEQAETQTDAEQPQEEGLFASVTTETWLFSGIAVLLLAAAIIFAKKYKKY